MDDASALSMPSELQSIHNDNQSTKSSNEDSDSMDYEADCEVDISHQVDSDSNSIGDSIYYDDDDDDMSNNSDIECHDLPELTHWSGQ